jgi:hypothetical protein
MHAVWFAVTYEPAGQEMQAAEEVFQVDGL